MRDTLFIDSKSHPVLKEHTTAPLIAVKMGEKGYWPVRTFVTAAQLNREEVPADVIESAVSASLFGWDCPAAAKAIAWMKAHDKLEVSD